MQPPPRWRYTGTHIYQRSAKVEIDALPWSCLPNFSNPMGRCPTCGSQKTLLCTLLVTGHAPTSLRWILCYGNASSPAPNRTNMASALKDKPFLQKLWAPTDLIYGLPLRLRIWHLGPWCFRNPAKKFTTSGGDCFLSKTRASFFFGKMLQDIKKFKAMHYWTEWLLQNSTSSEFLGVAAPKKNTSQTAPRNLPLKPKSPWCRCQTRQGQGCHCWFCGGQAFVWPN